MPNGEKVKRTWLCYSPSVCKVFCIQCKLFGTAENLFCRTVFFDWKNATRDISDHETMATHRNATLTLRKRGKTDTNIDAHLDEQCISERQYAKAVLHRIFATIRFLAERGLPFRGHDQDIGSPSNGHFLGTLELLAKFDPLLDHHIHK